MARSAQEASKARKRRRTQWRIEGNDGDSSEPEAGTDVRGDTNYGETEGSEERVEQEAGSDGDAGNVENGEHHDNQGNQDDLPDDEGVQQNGDRDGEGEHGDEVEENGAEDGDNGVEDEHGGAAGRNDGNAENVDEEPAADVAVEDGMTENEMEILERLADEANEAATGTLKTVFRLDSTGSVMKGEMEIGSYQQAVGMAEGATQDLPAPGLFVFYKLEELAPAGMQREALALRKRRLQRGNNAAWLTKRITMAYDRLRETPELLQPSYSTNVSALEYAMLLSTLNPANVSMASLETQIKIYMDNKGSSKMTQNHWFGYDLHELNKPTWKGKRMRVRNSEEHKEELDECHRCGEPGGVMVGRLCGCVLCNKCENFKNIQCPECEEYNYEIFFLNKPE